MFNALSKSILSKNENLHSKIRKEISDYLEIHKEEFNEFLFETEIGIINIEEYLKYIIKLGARVDN